MMMEISKRAEENAQEMVGISNRINNLSLSLSLVIRALKEMDNDSLKGTGKALGSYNTELCACRKRINAAGITLAAISRIYWNTEAEIKGYSCLQKR